MKGRLFLLAALALRSNGAYQNLIATTGGSTVFFTAPTGIAQSSWFVLQAVPGGFGSQPIAGSLADVKGLANIAAYSSTLAKVCGDGISGCNLSPNCVANFLIEGDGNSWAGSRWATFVRLNRRGDVAWIDQPAFCYDLAFLPPPALNGLYSVASQQLIAPSAGTKLANQHIGRRAITDDGRALVFAGLEIAWLSVSGLQPIVQTGSNFEAVSDSSGDNIVYNETDGGALHWISGGQDEALGFNGSAPSLTDNGKLLVFLDGANLLRAYDRQSRSTSAVSANAISTFTLGGDFAFAVNSDGQIVRFNLPLNSQAVWLQPSPEIAALDAPLGAQVCAFTCFGPQEPGYKLSLGMTVTLTGKSLSRSGLVAIVGGAQTPIVPASDTTASFQVPLSAPVSTDGYYDTSDLVISDGSALVSFRTKIVVVQ